MFNAGHDRPYHDVDGGCYHHGCDRNHSVGPNVIRVIVAGWKNHPLFLFGIVATDPAEPVGRRACQVVGPYLESGRLWPLESGMG